MANLLLRRLLPLLCLLGVLVPCSSATWSIVVVNRRTGEVCIASATCIPRQDLTEWTPVLLVGVGGGVTQSVLDNGQNKVRIWEGFLAGETPQAILARIRAEDAGSATRQFGIVDFTNDPLSFTGRQCGQARKSVAGVVDDLAYAIQGNILSDQIVVDEAERVLRASTGDTAQRVMAAMVRARELGGDGRCSCGLGSLGDCGIPTDFEKSAHIGYLLVARMGDTDGSCVVSESCVTGAYHLRLSIHGANALHDDPDPVDQLVERFAAWRAERVGRPDGIRSRVRAVDSLPADGVTERTLTIELADLEGTRLTHGGTTVELATLDGAPTHVSLGPLQDHGDGTYSCRVRAGTQSGLDRLVVRASDALVRATLYPYLELRSDPAARLHAGRDTLSSTAPEGVPFVVSEPMRPRAKYWLFTRLAGAKKRGFGSDALFARYLVPAVAPFFPGPAGELDADGRAEPSYSVPAVVLAPLIGLHLEWRARIFGPGAPLDSDPVSVLIGP
ncbi:MAG: DUF1028 domain-containing protein [Planctomycetes bacterium]|nr:DUF1028 domain-containing protein [Planctomycetota bacterium]